MSSDTKPAGIRLRPSEQRAILLGGDVLAALCAVYIALRYWAYLDVALGRQFSSEFLSARVDWWFYLLPIGWLLMLVDLYDFHRARNWRVTLRGIAIAAVGGLIFYALVYLFTRNSYALPRQGVGAFLVSASVLTLLWRLVYIRLFTASELLRRVIIIGAGAAGSTLVQASRKVLPPPFNLVGFIDDDRAKIGYKVENIPVLAGSEKLLKIIDQQRITDLIVAINGEIRGDTFQKILDAQENGIEISRMATIYEELLGRVPIEHLESDWIIRSFVDDARTNGFYEVGKRVIDIVGALVGLSILAMIIPLVALLTALDSGFPVFYSQIRLGRGGNPYKIIKFRTMRQDAESDGKARPASHNDPRITRVGNILRKTRIDEFPQFLNVLRGEMSIVGPRSERPQLVEHYQKQVPFYRARLLVKPGITGWAQVNFGYVSTVEDTITKLEYDLYYIKHRSVAMDLLIILRTIGTVLGFRGR
jgi:exopolysaccharide biosynthesis polyprenyl glycosylphosphotransferase